MVFPTHIQPILSPSGSGGHRREQDGEESELITGIRVTVEATASTSSEAQDALDNLDANRRRRLLRDSCWRCQAMLDEKDVEVAELRRQLATLAQESAALST